MANRLKIISAVQPLVFCFGTATALCSAVASLYAVLPCAAASLCVYRGRYYLAVRAKLQNRPKAAALADNFGENLGAAAVLYAFCAEHGTEISKNAVAELGKALNHGR